MRDRGHAGDEQNNGKGRCGKIQPALQVRVGRRGGERGTKQVAEKKASVCSSKYQISTGCQGLGRHRKIRSLQTREEHGNENTPRRGGIPGGESGLGRTGVGGRGKVLVINNPEMQERWKDVSCG